MDRERGKKEAMAEAGIVMVAHAFSVRV